jgi:hypothetical protein
MRSLIVNEATGKSSKSAPDSPSHHDEKTANECRQDVLCLTERLHG